MTGGVPLGKRVGGTKGIYLPLLAVVKYKNKKQMIFLRKLIALDVVHRRTRRYKVQPLIRLKIARNRPDVSKYIKITIKNRL